MNEVYLLIGGNMGDRPLYLSRAVRLIGKTCGIVKKRSACYETAAWGKEDQAPFLNQALMILTALEPGVLLSRLLQAEETLGRKRTEKYGPRQIDIDIILYNKDVIHQPGLTIPHPHMQDRRFVLAPLSEIAGDVVHPVLKKTISELLSVCPDPLSVNKIT